MFSARRILATLILAMSPFGALAAPKVVVDIIPTYGMTARIMAGVGAPELATPPGVSPHGYRMRPSDARRVSAADIVIWMGPQLTPWLESYVDGLASDAVRVTLLKTPNLDLMAYEDRHDEHEEEAHGHKEHGHKDHGHDDHKREKADHDAHGHHDHGHDHGSFDPHIWLDPQQNQVLLSAIAGVLSDADPENADAYAANLAAAKAELTALQTEIAALLAPVRDNAYVVQHDAYGYFERRFSLKQSRAFRSGAADAPGAKRLAAIRDTMAKDNVRCFFTDAGEPTKLEDAAIDGFDINRAVLDPAGRNLTLGPDAHIRLLRGIATTMRACLE